MTHAVVITSAAGFGELLRQSLEEQGMTVTTLSAEDDPAQAHPAPALLLIDGDAVPEARLPDLCAAWRAASPGVKIVLFPPEGMDKEALQALAPDKMLGKPFYLPDLLDAIAQLAPKPADPEAGNSNGASGGKASSADLPPNPPWLADVNLAAQHLTRLSLETAAQAAALVTGEGTLWAYAGELPQPAAEELAQTVAHHWNADGGQDFARFLHLEAVQRDFLLYATGVTAHLVLALLFDAQVPFTQMRAQATRLARALTQEAPLPPPPFGENALPPAPQEAVVYSDAKEDAERATDQGEPGDAWLPEDDLPLPWEEELPPEASVPLFEDVPPPQPDGAPRVVEDVSASAASAEEGEVSPSAPTRPVTLTELVEAIGPEALEALPESSASLPPPATLARADLTYACVLIPRFPQHHLTGAVARDLSQWMPTIATAYGWRLLHLAVRPNYLQWVVQVPPDTAPAKIVQVVREHTSRRLLAAHSHLQEEALGDDFWAPGYLVLSQRQPVPTPTIEAFIRQTRRRQGFA